MWNIYRCDLCKLHLISEESDFHVCMNIKDTRIEDEIKWVFDGEMWYPLKLRPTKVKQPDKTTEDGSIPKILEKGKLNQNFLHVGKAKIVILMQES